VSLPVQARLFRGVSAPPAPCPHGYRLARPEPDAPVEVRAAETSWSIRLHSRWLGRYRGDEAVGQTPAATTLRPASPAAGPPRPASDHIPTAPERPRPLRPAGSPGARRGWQRRATPILDPLSMTNSPGVA